MYGDLMLIIHQVKREWKTKKEKLRRYHEYLSKLAWWFEELEFTHLEREWNQFANDLEIYVVMARIDFGYKVQPVDIKISQLIVA
jgi:hypothetical protein